RTMNGNNSKTLVWDNIPEWALFSLEYGIDEELFLPDEDKEMITKFIAENFPNGYTFSVDWESYNVVGINPAFREVMKTYKATLGILYNPNDMRKITLSEFNSTPKDYRRIWTVERWGLPDWAEMREEHMGKRTLMVHDYGTKLLVEG